MISMFGSTFMETDPPVDLGVCVFLVYSSNQTITSFIESIGMSSHSFINMRFMSVNTCFSSSFMYSFTEFMLDISIGCVPCYRE